jgi:hypothetical protein
MSFRISTPQEIAAIFAKAIAEGRYNPHKKFFCEGCYREVDRLYHFTDGKHICPDCADEIGCGPKAFMERQARFDLAAQARTEAALLNNGVRS